MIKFIKTIIAKKIRHSVRTPFQVQYCTAGPRSFGIGCYTTVLCSMVIVKIHLVDDQLWGN